MGMKVKISRMGMVMTAGAMALGLVGVWREGARLSEIWKQTGPWFMVALAAMIHELGHIVSARWMGAEIRGIKLDLFGARLELGGLLSYKGEFCIAAGGPLANSLCVALLYPLRISRENRDMALFLGVSFILACVNLLPVGTLDGGRMLRSIVAWLGGDRAAEILLRGTTGLCLGMLWLLAAYALLRRGEFLSVFAFSLCLLFRTMGGGEHS